MFIFQSYDEFIDLAEQGNQYGLDQTMKSLAAPASETDGDDPYAMVSTADTDDVTFCMGSAVFKELSKCTYSIIVLYDDDSIMKESRNA